MTVLISKYGNALTCSSSVPSYKAISRTVGGYSGFSLSNTYDIKLGPVSGDYYFVD